MLVENELKKLKTFDSYFVGDDSIENYLVFQPVLKYFKKIGRTESISEWKSKGLSDEVITPPDNTAAPTLEYAGKRINVKFDGSCLIK